MYVIPLITHNRFYLNNNCHVFAQQKSTCTICHTQRRTVIRHLNPESVAKRRTKAVAVVAQPDHNLSIDLATVQLVKKKKKSSDKNAGLRIPVKMVSSSTEDVMPITKHTTSIVLKVPTAEKPPKAVQMVRQPPQHHKKAPAAAAKFNKPNQKGNNGNGGVGKSNQKKPAKLSASEKRAAEAKQRNSMLLLANVLKMKDSTAAKRPSGLEALLRK